MRSRWVVAFVLMVGTSVLPACSRDQPSAPGLHSITGHVVLRGYLVDASGNFAGTRVVGDADGVQVELAFGSQVVARTATVDGVYRFTGVGPGGYRARTRVIGPIADATAVLTVGDTDVAAGDTLRLESEGDLMPVPNPIAQATKVYFDLPDTQWVDIRILDVAGNTVRRIWQGLLTPGLKQVPWDGLDERGERPAGELYWVTLESLGEYRAHVLFR